MDDVVKRLLALAGVPIQVEQQVEPARAADNLLVRADASRLQREIGWQPRIPLEQTLADTLNYWRLQP
jgi:GDP-4-dehydro-6-deoxy-D-mannose reductase